MISESINSPVIPEHIAIILDGNGRWAAKHNVPRAQGHKAGCETLEGIVEDCARLGVKYLTVYAFSTENWKRSEEEVGALMQLFRFYMVKLVDIAMKNDVRVKMIGDIERFDPDIRDGITNVIAKTDKNEGMTFTFAVNYGGRDEIRRCIKRMNEKGMDMSSLSENDISSNLDTAGIPDPDLLIRTSGEIRISNFLLWQIAYSEIYITDTLWPDFHRDELEKAIIAYNSRNRRFGGR
ncbi:MAG: isoprenyl transferase [Lachnospiraceae bacterium]|nr:isoprenyl transferase [Candidatus Darwinimomas equi]